MADAVAVIQSTLAPMFLVTGAGVFLNFLQARLFRVVDRMRAVGEDLEKPGRDTAARDRLAATKASLLHRGQRIRNALFFGTLTLALTVLTALALIADALLALRLPAAVPLALFSTGLLSLAAALALAVADTFASLRAATEEMGAAAPR